MKKLITITAILLSSSLWAQDLKLEKTYTITQDESYVVPSGRVWMITSMDQYSVMVAEGFTFISSGSIAQIVESSAGGNTPYISFPIWLNEGSKITFGCAGGKIAVSEYSMK